MFSGGRVVHLGMADTSSQEAVNTFQAAVHAHFTSMMPEVRVFPAAAASTPCCFTPRALLLSPPLLPPSPPSSHL